MASYLYESLQPSSQYYDKKSELSESDYKKRLESTTTVYVGNLHCSTSESALYELFSRAGQIKDLIMGVTKDGIFAGFCFVMQLIFRKQLCIIIKNNLEIINFFL